MKVVPVRNAATSIVAVLSLIVLLRYAQDLFTPIILSVLIAYAANPLVTAIQSIRIPRALAALLVVFGLVFGAGFGAYLLRNQANVVLQTLPEGAAKVRRRIEEFRGGPAQTTSAISSIQEAAKEIEKTAQVTSAPTGATKGVAKVEIVDTPLRITDLIRSGSLGLLGLIGQAVLVVFLVFFLLASGDLFKRKLVRIVGSTLGEKRLTVETLNEIDTQIQHCLVVQVLTSAIVASCTAVALWVLGMSQPVIWGIAAGILNSVPYFGAIIVSSGLALLGFLQFDSVTMAVKVALVALIITGLEGFVLTPMLMGRAARINGVAMFISILFWSWLWGVFGMIVAVPLTMIIKSVCDRVERLQPFSELLSDR
jgi:predicted PurR-regulated permease PerM